MVKADGYGLGLERVVRSLDAREPWGFGVAAVAEGVALRAFGVERPIVVCSPTPPADIEALVAADLQPFIGSVEALEHLSDVARRRGREVVWHLDVDTGMGRSGFPAGEVDAWAPAVLETRPGLRLGGIDTHLHSADESVASVDAQWEALEAVRARLGLSDDLPVHVLNSAGALRRPEHAATMVRPGIFLYGGTVGEGTPAPVPVAAVRATVAHVRDAEAGTTLGYGSTYTATTSERWGTLSIGYGDGIPRSLSNRGEVIVNGVRVPIIGRISMDVTVVDISGVAGVAPGTVATLIGRDGGVSVSVDEVAAWAGTISYEVLTGLTPRLPRIWA